MKSRLFGNELTLITILCVVGIFLFPASAGPYSAIHGPVTALQAVRAAMKIRWNIALAALVFSDFAREIRFTFFGESVVSMVVPLRHTSILRC
jgi:hypothetical protein